MDFTLKTLIHGPKTKAECLIVPFYDAVKLPTIVDEIDDSLNGQIKQLYQAKKIKTEANVATTVYCSKNDQWDEVVFVGAKKEATPADLSVWFSSVAKILKQSGVKSACVLVDALDTKESEDAILTLAARAMQVSTYQYDTTLSEKKKKTALKAVTFLTQSDSKADKQAVNVGKAMACGMMKAKELGNLPGNICTPSYLAAEAQKLAKNYEAISTDVLSEAELKKLKMGSLLSVTAGTDEPAKVIIMKYMGGNKTAKPTVLVGKGVTFDSGGISLKPGARMDEMKFDMCGAASVFGAITAIAELELPINVIGVVGAVENMPSGRATKPGDVITSMSGQTIEVLNTDAEGRLVLCDLLTYAERFKPKAVIDIATLTGACVVALGHHASAVYANNDTLSDNLKSAGEKSLDRAWPMPLWEDYNKQLESKFADMGNIGGPGGGSITAACFLSRFAKKYDWAHLDIAGSAWQKKMSSGRPVSLLTQYLIDYA